MIEENMHLVKMSSKSGNGYMNGLTIERLQRKMNGKEEDQSKSCIDLLYLKLSNRPIENDGSAIKNFDAKKAAFRSPGKSHEGSPKQQRFINSPS